MQVMIGIHGNGLTHQMWMEYDTLVVEVRISACPPPSSMPRSGDGERHIWQVPDPVRPDWRLTVQLFPQNTFLRDYQSLAEALGHAYHAVVSLLANPAWSLASGWHSEYEDPGILIVVASSHKSSAATLS